MFYIIYGLLALLTLIAWIGASRKTKPDDVGHSAVLGVAILGIVFALLWPLFWTVIFVAAIIVSKEEK